MFSNFYFSVISELGQLDPNWFEVLTARASSSERIVADKDDLCANQEGNFKTPLEKTAGDSQLFSTPKVFRHSRIVSPETEDEPFGKNKLFLISMISICEGFRHILLISLLLSFINYAKHISESLGAQINPDISWTSSLNTPPAVPSTLILCAVSSETQNCLQPSINQTEDVWQQTLPDAVDEEEVCGQVEENLDGAENVDSVFFANSSSALRKVKPDRIKCKQVIQTNDKSCSSKDTTVPHSSPSSEAATADLESGRLPSTPLAKPGVPAVSQWSPLSLSEIPPCALESSVVTERQQSDTDSVQLFRPSVKITNSGLIKKKRQFVYTIPTSKTQVPEKGYWSQKMDPPFGVSDSGNSFLSDMNVKPLEKGSGESECCSTKRSTVQNQRRVVGENIPCFGGAKVQDFDMSQLCKEFAQDFSQVAIFGQQDKVAKDTFNDFSPSACLSSMKQAKQKARQAEPLRETDGISNRRQTCSLSHDSVSDSGLQSGAADITYMTASSVLPHSENIDQSQQCVTTSFPPIKEETGNEHLESEAKTTLQKLKERQTLDPERESESHIENKSMCQSSRTEGVVDRSDCIPLSGQICDSLPKETDISLSSAYSSGFRTASDKGIHIPSANLEKAKRLFEETEGERTFCTQSTKYDHSKHKVSLNNRSLPSKMSTSNQPSHLEEAAGNISSQLTASEKADVTELCSLLEEADSQFEFTQFKTAKLKWQDQNEANPSQKPDRELDPDFLAGINFDDSFNSDGGKHSAVTVIPDKMALVSDQSVDKSSSAAITKENSSVARLSENISEDKNGLMLAGANNAHHRAECGEANKLDNSNPLTLGVAFKTAGGNMLRVSKEFLCKARALFADLEGNFVSSNKQVLSVGDEDCTKSLKNSKMDTQMFQSDFRMAGGKEISISTKYLQQASAFFRDCDVIGHKDNMSHKKNTKAPPESVENKKSFSKCTNLQVNTSDEHVAGCSNFENVGKKVSVSADAMRKAECLLNQICTYEDIKKENAKTTGDQSDDGLKAENTGFQTSSGKEVAISPSALKKKALLKECERDEDEMSFSLPHPKGKVPVTGPPMWNSGFSAASGKPVVVSSEALQRAKMIFTDISLNVDTPTVSNTIRNDEKCTCAQDNTEKRPCGFTTAGGAKVQVSQKSLLKAKEIFKEYDDLALTKAMQEADAFFDCDVDGSKIITEAKKDDVDVSEGVRSKEGDLSKLCPHQTVRVNTFEEPRISSAECTSKQGNQREETLPQQNGGFQTASGKRVNISSEALKNAKTLLSDCEGVENEISVNPPQSRVSKQNGGTSTEKIHCGFTTAGGAKVHVSEKNLLKAKLLFEEFDNSAKTSLDADVSSLKENDCTVSSNSKALFSEGHHLNESLFKLKPAARNVFEAENGFTKGINEQVNQQEGALLQQGGGFQTASGKAVAVSSEALTRAKILLNENEGAEDNIRVSSPVSKIPISETFLLKSGFSSASGNPVKFSSEALQKAKVLLSDTSLSTNIPTSADTKRTDEKHDAQSKAEDIHRDVMTAGGKVHVSEKRVLKAAHLLKEFADGEFDCSFSNSTSPQSTLKLDLPKAKDVERTNVVPVRDRDIHAKRRDPCEVSSFSTTTGADNINDILEESSLLDINQSSSKRAEPLRTDESSNLNLQSLNLTGCTETQHRFLAQEALDCTKALLEDEVLAGQSLSVTSEATPLPDDLKSNNRSTEDGKRRKRLLEDADVIGQPHPKRPLLDKFDRTVNSPKGSALHPVKCCPNGAIKDRGVFKYSASLHPNITKPLRLQKTTLPHCSSPGDGRLSHSKMLPFVPPFVRNVKREIPNTPELKGNTRTPVFVPPFKKQRTVLQDSSSKQHEEDKQVLPSAVESGIEKRGVYYLLTDGHQNIELARDMQDMRIRKKKRQTIRPLPGSLFLTKTSGVARISLKVAVNGKKPSRYNPEQLYEYGVQKNVSEFTNETAESFRFNLLQFVKRETFIDGDGVHLADGGWLVPSNDWTHYVTLPVLFQKQWGADVDHSCRPALRKIMEKDDTASKTLILCVCEIVSRGPSPNRQGRSDTKAPQSADAKADMSCAEVRLTDGWYAIRAQLDEPLTAMLHKGLLTVGVKLIIHGAQLMGSQDACSPLEAPESLFLKICANSSRRAQWDAKLGFHRDPRPFLLPLSSLYSNGGPVGCVDIIVLRSYPIQWMERKADGSVVFRSARAEEKEARRYNHHQQTAMETLFAKIQAEFEKEEKGNNKPQWRTHSINRQDIASLQDGEELYEAVGDDPAEAHLSERQLETLHAYRRSLMEKMQVELQDRYRRALEADDNKLSCPKRDVTAVWRLYIADSKAQSNRVYQLNLWRPSSDLQSLLKEGCRYKVYNLVASCGKKRSGIETVQLTGTKKTQFQDLQVSPRTLVSVYMYICIFLLKQDCSSPAFYLADGKLNFVKVRCFSGLSQAGLEDVIKPRVLLALSNLQLRGQSLHPTPVVYAGDLTVFSTNPKDVHLQESLSQLKTLCQDNFFQSAEEKLSLLVKSDGMRSICSPSLQPQTPDSRKQDSKSSVIPSLGSFTPVSRKPPAETASSEKDSKTLKRKRALDYLSRIPSPPPLSHLASAVSPYVKKTFNPPRRSGPPSAFKSAQTPVQKPTNSLVEKEWVNDEELAMIDTQALLEGDMTVC
uniref:BRCA2 DNA repair associated n=1 Tax=Kryptolebias marmoratus TaxID=37003 RepID=A0A3Q3FAJ5_KRYMA